MHTSCNVYQVHRYVLLLQVDLVYAHGESSRPQKRDWQAMMLQVNSTHTGKLTFTVKQWDTQRRKQCNHQNLFEWLQMLKSMYITFQASLEGKLFKKIFFKKLIFTQNFGIVRQIGFTFLRNFYQLCVLSIYRVCSIPTMDLEIAHICFRIFIFAQLLTFK